MAFRNDSFLRKHEVREGQFLDVNQLPAIKITTRDESYVISPEFDERPDLLAHVLYESSNLWWVFALRNPDILKDPIRDFTAGKVIMLPAVDTVSSMISGR
jgi:hypothetical protein